MTTTEKLKKIANLILGLEPEQVELASAKLADGTEITYDKLEVGGIVKIGEEVAPDGEHALEDGSIIKIENGVITAITPKIEEVEEPEVTIEMKSETLENGDVLSFDALEVGQVILLNGEPSPTADYVLADGTTIKVVEGAIQEITPKAEPTEMEKILTELTIIKDNMQKLNTRNVELEAVIAELTTGFGVFKGDVEKLNAAVEVIAKSPSTEPLQFKKDVKTEQLEKFGRNIDAIRKFRK